MIDISLLQQYIRMFFGYGNLNSPYWFIGKEEGGGETLGENILRMKTWENLNKTTTVDIIDFHKSLGYKEKDLKKLQPTWVKIAQILQVLERGNSEYSSLRDYLFHNLGRYDCNHCLFELMPLPARNTSRWLFGHVTQELPELTTRKSYMETITPRRIEFLKLSIKKYKPKLVVFYSTTENYKNYWYQISDSNGPMWSWEQMSGRMKVGYYRANNNLFIICPHPTSYGITRDDFPTLGLKIKTMLDKE